MALFTPYKLGGLVDLANRAVMAPMTRNRATAAQAPTDIMATYYGQRASVGLIVTEGTSPDFNGAGYARMPAIANAEHARAWRKVTDAVHARGGRIFLQMMHTGRIGHPVNMAEGAEVVAPSAVAAAGKIYTDNEGMLDHPVPRELTTAEVKDLVQIHAKAAKRAVEEAGFDGIEVHGANGYLVEQFLRPTSNQRTDEYGGSEENRNRFAVEVVEAISKEIGIARTGIRISPYGVFNDQPYDAAYDSQYLKLVATLSGKVGYIHIVDHSSMGAPAVDADIKTKIRGAFDGCLILSGGYDAERASKDIAEGRADLVAFGRPLIANPDFVERIKSGSELAQPDFATFYTPGEKGYTDYSTIREQEEA
ncbi:NADH:flavin oxidoreductase/NADH oxidase [Hyaloraphidium curvatum]|nr:NADH:flavin oxidoreductase/NADH oxidase [Hyaloraphidium curvatum]